MKKVIITGSSGMIGGLVLQHCLENSQIEKVTSLVRRPSGIKHAKLNEVIVNDFANYQGLEHNFIDIDIAYYCIGVYTGAVPRDEFKRITVDYTFAFADQIKKNCKEANLCFLSGAGADRKEKSKMMFALDKGIAENYLSRIGLENLHVFRPGYIYPVTPRKEPNFSYRLSRSLYPIMKILMPAGVITSEQLALAIFKTGMEGGNQEVYENREIKELVSEK